MEPCCGLASTAGRKAARRAIFRIAMRIDVQIAGVCGLMEGQIERFGVFVSCDLLISNTVRADQGYKERVKVNDGPKE